MSAPVLWADISRQAWTIGAMIVTDVLSFRLKMRAMKLNRFWRMPIICKKPPDFGLEDDDKGR